jgi:hypothetical protein
VQATTTAEDATRQITLTAADPDADPLTFSIVSGPAHGVLSGIVPDIGYTPAADYAGTDRFTFDVTDGRGGRSTAVVTITVTPVNDAPVALAQSISTLRGTPVRFTLDAADVDGDPLTFTVPASISSGTLTQVSGATFEYSPNADFIGSDMAEYSVSDGVLSATAVLRIQVTPEPVVITTTSLAEARLRRPYVQQLQVSGGAAPYTWSVAAGALPRGLVLGSTSGIISGEPTTTGSYSFTVRVTDRWGMTDETALTIRVRRR